jgi:carboxylesterase
MSQPTDYSFYLKGSSRKGVLLVHGLTGTPSEMRFVGKRLHRRGFTIYAPMLAGHCTTLDALLATRYEDWIESLRAALHRLHKDVNNVYAAGICVGGVLALYLAHLAPRDIDGVAIYSPALDYDGWNQPKYSRLVRMISGMLVHIPAIRTTRFEESPPFGIKSDTIRAAVMEAGHKGALAYFPATALYETCRLNRALKRALPRVKTPTLLLHAREDDVCHPRNSYTIQKRHGGRCEVSLLEDSYHMIHVDQERQRVADLTAAFFDSL